jgi:hypothetical protein
VRAVHFGPFLLIRVGLNRAVRRRRPILRIGDLMRIDRHQEVFGTALPVCFPKHVDSDHFATLRSAVAHEHVQLLVRSQADLADRVSLRRKRWLVLRLAGHEPRPQILDQFLVALRILDALQIRCRKRVDALAFEHDPRAAALRDLPDRRCMRLAAGASALGARDEHLAELRLRFRDEAGPGRFEPAEIAMAADALRLLKGARQRLQRGLARRGHNERVECMMTVVIDALARRILLQPLHAETAPQAIRQGTRAGENPALLLLLLSGAGNLKASLAGGIHSGQQVKQNPRRVLRVVQIARPELLVEHRRILEKVIALLAAFHLLDGFDARRESTPARLVRAEPLERRAAFLLLVLPGEAEGLVHEGIVPRPAPRQDVIDLDGPVRGNDCVDRDRIVRIKRLAVLLAPQLAAKEVLGAGRLHANLLELLSKPVPRPGWRWRRDRSQAARRGRTPPLSPPRNRRDRA